MNHFGDPSAIEVHPAIGSPNAAISLPSQYHFLFGGAAPAVWGGHGGLFGGVRWVVVRSPSRTIPRPSRNHFELPSLIECEEQWGILTSPFRAIAGILAFILLEIKEFVTRRSG